MHTSETRVYLAILTATVVLGSILSFFVATIISHQRNRSALHISKLNRDIKTTDDEKVRIAQDLHDDLGATLSAIKLRLYNLEVYKTEDKYTVEQCRKFLADAIAKIRGISENMMPNTLQFSGLTVALHELLDMLIAPTNIQVRPDFSFELYNKKAGIHIYRMVQEIVTNTVKHAAASTIKISIKRYGDMLHLRIADNGKGFIQRSVLKKYKGQGLRNIRSRADILQAKMYLTALPGEGIAYFFIIPDKQPNG